MASFFCHVAGVAMQFRLERIVRPLIRNDQLPILPRHVQQANDCSAANLAGLEQDGLYVARRPDGTRPARPAHDPYNNRATPACHGPMCPEDSLWGGLAPPGDRKSVV